MMCGSTFQLKNEEDIVIAKMDATANDVPSPYKVSGYVATLEFILGSECSCMKLFSCQMVKTPM